MLVTNSDLIKIGNISKRTFYRRLKELKEIQHIKKINGNFYHSNTAYSISVFMGFEDSFKVYLISSLKKISELDK